MTWKELKNRIEKMPADEQEKNVTVWEEGRTDQGCRFITVCRGFVRK